jgi:hypothetical protein
MNSMTRWRLDFVTIHIVQIYAENLMTQLHCYVPDDIAQQVQRRASQAGLSLSRYLAELVKRDVSVNLGWSEMFFDNLGQWEGEPLKRPEQLPLEDRLELK